MHGSDISIKKIAEEPPSCMTVAEGEPLVLANIAQIFIQSPAKLSVNLKLSLSF